MEEPEAYAKRVIELHGGHDKFFNLMDKRFREFNEIWNQDAHSIGRVLRSHLGVEHFLTNYIIYTNENIGALDKIRLTFSQKVEMLSDEDPSISFLKPGLRRLNAIRNRLAHKLHVEVNADDRKVLLGIQMFTAMRRESIRRQGPKPDDPLSILEQFALFAAGLLHAGTNPNRDLWTPVRIEDETNQRNRGTMSGRTEPVQRLVSDVLTSIRQPYSEDITDEVCLAIEARRVWLNRYNALVSGLGRDVVNNWIGQYTRQLTARQSEHVRKARSSLIKTYSTLV